MRRFNPMRIVTLLLTVALVAPSVATAGPREDAQALADAIAAFGYPAEAAEIETLLASMPDADVQALADVGINEITAGLYSYLEAEQTAVTLGAAPATARPPLNGPSTAGTVRMRDQSTGLPDADYHDLFPLCPAPPESRNDFTAIIATHTSLLIAEKVVTVARHALEGAKFGCLTTVVVLGVGGNPQSLVCTVLQVALAVTEVALEFARQALVILDRCDKGVDYAEIEGSYERLGHLHGDLETHAADLLAHDADIKSDVATHDADVKVLLDEVLTRLTALEGDLALVKKSQLEIAMNKRLKIRPSVFYEERLDEVCEIAQEAIDDLPAVYLIAAQAQRRVDDGNAFKISDPKRAADECVTAYEFATRRSQSLQ